MTDAESLRRFGHKALVWCDENGEPATDQTNPPRYIRPHTKAEAKEQAQIAWVDEVLAADPEFERCTADGVPDANGTRWKLRDRFGPARQSQGAGPTPHCVF